jgi:hypothetical protein
MWIRGSLNNEMRSIGDAGKNVTFYTYWFPSRRSVFKEGSEGNEENQVISGRIEASGLRNSRPPLLCSAGRP